MVAGQNQVTVRYRIKATELFVFCVFATFLFVWFALATGGGSSRALTAVALVWLWVLGFNYLLMWLRMTSAFGRVATAVGEAEVQDRTGRVS